MLFDLKTAAPGDKYWKINLKAIVSNKPKLEGVKPIGFFQSMEELNLGLLESNAASGRDDELNPGPPQYKPNALITWLWYIFIVF